MSKSRPLPAISQMYQIYNLKKTGGTCCLDIFSADKLSLQSPLSRLSLRGLSWYLAKAELHKSWLVRIRWPYHFHDTYMCLERTSNKDTVKHQYSFYGFLYDSFVHWFFVQWSSPWGWCPPAKTAVNNLELPRSRWKVVKSAGRWATIVIENTTMWHEPKKPFP